MADQRTESPSRDDGGDAAPHAPRKRRAKTSERRPRKRKRRRSRLARAAYWCAVAGVWMFLAFIGVLAWVFASLPPIHSLEIPKRPPSIQIVGIDGRPFAMRGEGGPPAALKELPRYVPQAFIAIEDRRFYSHHGIDPLGISRAVVRNVLRRGVTQGGSTITQQLAKNLFLTQERTLTRKLQEAVLALWIEH